MLKLLMFFRDAMDLRQSCLQRCGANAKRHHTADLT